tara:strand:+ start:329 stop:1876 length:1548 start_codon:yes stop_codon:yes gene_type:complete
MKLNKKIKILWIDDEIDLLQSHIFFLKAKGYLVDTALDGLSALEMIIDNNYDLVFLDENMTGLTGLETLVKIKELKSQLPVVMITKNEEEQIMEEAIGSKISDYLIKPVNPNQILLSIKKNLNLSDLISSKTVVRYNEGFREISSLINQNLNYKEWIDLYKKIVFWELELIETNNIELTTTLYDQYKKANHMFFKYIKENYHYWFSDSKIDVPIMSHNLFKKEVMPLIENKDDLFVIVIDNLRYDQWKLLEKYIIEHFNIKENLYYSILPTSTEFSRNSFFAGIMPLEISERFPQFWSPDDKKSKNKFEYELLQSQLSEDIDFNYYKITNYDFGKKIYGMLPNLLNKQLNVLVFNFIDILSHAKSEISFIKELTVTDSAYRSLTESWYKNSYLSDILKYISDKKRKIFLTTDHGTIGVNNPIKILADKETNTNLRFKYGKNINVKNSDVFLIDDPEKIKLPKYNLSTKYHFTHSDNFFVYPSNYNYYVNLYKNTFQHGGISLQEVLVPYVILEPK